MDLLICILLKAYKSIRVQEYESLQKRHSQLANWNFSSDGKRVSAVG